MTGANTRPFRAFLFTCAASALFAVSSVAFAQTVAATEKFGLPKTPADFFPIMEARFNSLDVEAALKLFNEQSIMIDGDGKMHRGVSAIRSELQRYFGMGLQMKLTPRAIYSSGDTALSINDWFYDGMAKDGTRVQMSGSTSDVLHRGTDGIWRYVIDNPFGTRVGK